MLRRSLLWLLLAFGLLAAIYSLTTPLFEAPDEPWHFAYVRWLAEGHGLPRFDDDASGAYQEAAQPPLYYAVAALINSPIDDDDLPELFWHNPQFGYQAGGTVNDNKNMLIHTERERFPWHGAVLAVRLARLVSLAFGVVAIVATYGLAREALPGRSVLGAVAAGVVAFTPQFLFISGVVSNDAAAAAACTLALWALARIIHLGPTPRRATAAGLTIGLALLSKTSALLLLPIGLLALAIARREGASGPETRRHINGTRRFPWREALIMLSVAAAVGGWWYVRNWVLFSDPLGLQVHINTPWGRSGPASLTDVLSELPQVFRSFWGAFGWGHVELPGLLYVALGTLVAVSLLGWVWQFARLQRAESSRRPVPFSVRTILLAGIWLAFVLVALLRWMQQVGAPHGRLLFPALGAWGLLLAVGWSGLLPPRDTAVEQSRTYDLRTRIGTDAEGSVTRCALLAPVAGLFLLSLIVPFAIIRPAFALPHLLSSEEATQGVTPATLIYGGQARLLGYRVEPDSVTAGDSVQVTLCWEALQVMDKDYTLYIHLLGRDNARVGERTTYPGQGRFPTTLWPVGRAFCETYRLEVEPWAPAPELYALEVGLYDADTGWRLPAQYTTGQPAEPPGVGLVRITPATPTSCPDHPVSYELGGQIALVGYDSSAENYPDDSALPSSSVTFTLTLCWEALQVPQGDYKVFAHLIDGTGALVAQDDAPPRGGSYPTWAWQPGDLIPDSHQVTLTDDRPPGPYHWSVGMYRPDTLERLPVVGVEGVLPDGVILLGEIQD